MRGNRYTHLIGTIFNLSYPLVVAILSIFFKLRINIDFRIMGFEKVLESMITFSSIIIGFYTAMYGVLITLKDSDVMKTFRSKRLTGILRYQLYDSLIISFLVLVLSVALQVLINYPSNLTGSLTNIWFFIIGYFVATSFRAISLLLNIMFHNEKAIDPKQEIYESNEEKKARYTRLKPTDTQNNKTQRD